jgi:hypothetical protein
MSKWFTLAAGIVTLTVATGAIAQAPPAAPSPINSELLTWKKLFGDMERAALAQPFTGIHTSDGIQPGLFPIRATGVPTDSIRRAASDFLATLAPSQLIRTVFAVDDEEWRRWSNVDNGIYVRQGVSLKELDPAQRKAAMALMRASLSAKGLELAQSIMKTDQTLREINDGAPWYDSELYFFTIMGKPSATEPWGWQVDGHHLVINYFILGDQVVMTPVFMGAEPAIATTGRYAGNTVLQSEQDQGVAFMRGLTPSQQRTATLHTDKPGDDIRTEANHDNEVLGYGGVKVAELSETQKSQLLRLINLYVGNMRDDQARVRLSEVQAHMDDTWFAWAGGTSDSDVFYYRIHSPVVLIEFDHQLPVGTTSINPPGRPTRAHIHTVVRTPNGNDYGKDLLREHLEAQRH